MFSDIMNFSETQMKVSVLEAIEKILCLGEDHTKSSDGVNVLFEKIQISNIPKILIDLQTHPSPNVFEIVNYILQKYFDCDYKNDQEID